MQQHRYKFVQVILFFFLSFALTILGHLCYSDNCTSLFWPANAVLTGLLIRFPQLDYRLILPAIYPGLVVGNILNGVPLLSSIQYDVANMAFIVTAYAVLLSTHLTQPYPRRLRALIRVFPASLIAAAVCAGIGSNISQVPLHSDLTRIWLIWFCEQLSTAIMLLPLVITLPRRHELPQLFHDLKTSPLLPLVLLVICTVTGMRIGGSSNLLFPLPALMWCAISYPIFFTCLLTMITGISEIVLVASTLLNIQETDGIFRIESLAPVRLGMAAMAISPLIVALSTTANKKLVARITRRADYDFLTGALTRSGLSSRLDAIMARSDRQGVFCGAVFIIDIDHFKKINDNWGHAAGDYVLAKTVERIRQSLQPGAIISRMGGEEFLVLMNGISRPRAYLIAERLRLNIEKHSLALNGEDLSVTISIGTSMLNNTHDGSLDASINEADEQLYIAKSSGRNRVSPEFVF
ncbi:GGDEF domain-containing protein [Erwinia psidii]|uniref:diguanylate cyclase n=1 Tax=Erwinia psidii TaxID=69224 RepID=A0A3N6SHA2_9GAMM|nr:GGDEF domain-containing protein [Erwinia psidii]MCX8956305.1 sensor domain-containing diguanylate cyclase [Erwinia psidii]MCX8963481.1 sensor domain-containing diguanylate cyclase [Erwinia psidii]RQM39303.1 sensor domain-containing diguanylate cyclase [Erwinia psidii]